MSQLLQICGAVLILAAYILVQFRRLDPRSYLSLGLNASGSCVLALLAALDYQWGFLLLEGVWAVVSLWGIAARWRGPGSGRLS